MKLGFTCEPRRLSPGTWVAQRQLTSEEFDMTVLTSKVQMNTDEVNVIAFGEKWIKVAVITKGSIKLGYLQEFDLATLIY